MQKFNYHQHTYRCGHADLDMKDEDYIKEYIEIGFDKVAFTDHCPQKSGVDVREKMRMKYSQKDEYLDSIKRLQQKYADKIQIESGYEVEYLPGEEDNLTELKNETDKIVLGQHFVYDDNNSLKIVGRADLTDEELIRYANYIEKAMQLNIPDIIAHPDLFMLNKENFGEIEEKVANMICKAAEKYNVPLEINLNNIFANTYYENKTLNNDSLEMQKEKLAKVKYPCKKFWEIATKYNIKVLYGIDTHHRGQILLWSELLELAKEVIGKDVLEKLDFVEE